MPDIAMCFGGECPLKMKCYRYRAIPSEFRQAYFYDPPYEGEKCEHFHEIGDRRVRGEDEVDTDKGA